MAKVIHIQKPPPQMCAEFIPNAAESTVHDSFQSGLTAQIARRSVRILLEEHGFRIQRILASIDTHEDDTVDRKFVERTAELIKRVIKNSPMELPTVAQLAQEHWLIHAGNVYSEYMQLSQQLFQDGINWGRLIAFIGFTSTYCLYAMEQGIQDSIVESVAAWMVQVLGRDHVEWFQQHSWDQFVKYAERLLQERPHRPNPNPDRGAGRWQLAAVGAVGLGAVLAFAISNALS